MVARSRYLEDEVEQALERGVSQYVILGAGLDSFAYRRKDVAKLVRVFEVDHPATQAWKRSRLKQLGVELPPNLTLVPVDFERQSLIESLRQNGYSTEVPGFFSWLGVIPYLTPDAIFTTLRTVAALPPGTQIIFEYGIPKKMLDEESQKYFDLLMAAGADRSEPFRSFLTSAHIPNPMTELSAGSA